MLKYWLALLLVLNALVLAWQWDAFARWGHGPNQQREPERLKQQVRPDAIKFERLPPDGPGTEPPATEARGDASDVSPDALIPSPDALAQNPTRSASAPAAPRVQSR